MRTPYWSKCARDVPICDWRHWRATSWLLLLASLFCFCEKHRLDPRSSQSGRSGSRAAARPGAIPRDKSSVSVKRSPQEGPKEGKRVTMVLSGDPRESSPSSTNQAPLLDQLDGEFGYYVKRVLRKWLASHQRQGTSHQLIFVRIIGARGHMLVRQKDKKPESCRARLILVSVPLYSDEANRRTATAETTDYGEDCCEPGCEDRAFNGWELDLFAAVFNRDSTALRSLVHPTHGLLIEWWEGGLSMDGLDAEQKERKLSRKKLTLAVLEHIDFDDALTAAIECSKGECPDIDLNRKQLTEGCFSCSHQGLETYWLLQKKRAYLIRIDQLPGD
jgi:hypothetical protein